MDADWWEQEIAPGLTRNEAVWAVIGIAIAALFFLFPINWDAIFGWR